MSQTVLQNLPEDIVVLLVDSSGDPVTGLDTSDITVSYFKDSGSAFVVKSLADTGAVLTTEFTEPFALADGMYLSISVDGDPSQTVTFDAADFSNIAQATAAEVLAVINTQTTDLTATEVSDAVVLTTTATGELVSIEITSGTANNVLGFPTDEVFGTTPFKEIGGGVYTYEFSASNLDTVGAFVVRTTGGSIAQNITLVNIIENTDSAESSTSGAGLCVITGQITTLDGDPVSGASVIARVLGFPTISGNIAAITDESVTALTDSDGNFELPLTRLVTVDISIPSVNLRRQLVVPNLSTANLFLIE